ncbi:Augmin subunit, partial [Thalictrum thalictroides]
ELEPFPEIDCFNGIHTFHQELCKDYSPRDHFLKALLESMGAFRSTRPEAIAAAEIIAAVLTARASARDPSEIPSICRFSAALQYHAGLASVLESLEFCLKLRGSKVSALEDYQRL